MTTFDVIAKIKSATSLKVEHRRANCAICQRPGSEIAAIYAPRGDSIPLCPHHFQQLEQTLNERLAELKKK